MPSRVLRSTYKYLPPVGGVQAFPFAASLIGIAILLRLPFDAVAHAPVLPFVTFYPILALIGFLCGLRLGLATVALAGLIGWYFWMEPLQSWGPKNAYAVSNLVLFFFGGSFTALLGAAARQLLEELTAREADRARAAREAVHRVKNLIAVVLALSRQAATGASSVEDYRKRLDERLAALGRAQDLLLHADWDELSVADLIEAVIGPYRASPNFVIEGGEAIPVPAQWAGGLSLALYELGANSLKYGALNGGNGEVRVSWRKESGRCLLLWRESGGAEKAAEGYGAHLVRGAFGMHKETQVRYAVGPCEVLCDFEWPCAGPSASRTRRLPFAR